MREISINIRKGKFVFVLFLYTLIFMLLIVVCIIGIFFTSDSNEKLKSFALLPVDIFFGYFLIRTFRISKFMKGTMVVQNAVFTDHTRFFGKKTIQINEIESIENYRDNQFRIKLKNQNRSTFAIINQLKGYDIYLSNYLIKQSELLKLVQCLRNNMASEITLSN